VVSTHYERIRAHDGGSFDAFCAAPDRDSSPGVILFQEIFGINDNIRGVAERLADVGYSSLPPTCSGASNRALSATTNLPWPTAWPWCSSWIGLRLVLTSPRPSLTCARCPTAAVLSAASGSAWEGALTYVFAASSRVNGRGPDAAVPYYGSGIHQMLGQADSIESDHVPLQEPRSLHP
jgi:carboxymethylenebutenolidase